MVKWAANMKIAMARKHLIRRGDQYYFKNQYYEHTEGSSDRTQLCGRREIEGPMAREVEQELKQLGWIVFSDGADDNDDGDPQLALCDGEEGAISDESVKRIQEAYDCMQKLMASIREKNSIGEEVALVPPRIAWDGGPGARACEGHGVWRVR